MNGKRKLFCEINGSDTVLPLRQNVVYLRSTWGLDGVGSYFYSIDNKAFFPLGGIHRFSWGSYQGYRIGIFNFNVEQDKGFMDVDWFRYRCK